MHLPDSPKRKTTTLRTNKMVSTPRTSPIPSLEPGKSLTIIKVAQRMRRSEAKFLPEITATLESQQFNCSDICLLGEGSESSAFQIIGPDEQDLVLKISSPLTNGWEPDWGRRPYDARIIEVAGEAIHELECGCFWYVQEYGQTFDRGDEIADYLWEEFQDLVCNYANNLFVDDTELVKQLAVVERDGIETLVVIDYPAFCAQDQNPPFSPWEAKVDRT